MKRLVALVVAGLLAVSGVFLTPATAQAATTVTIKTIPGKTVAKGKKATVKPVVKKSGKVKISSKTLTVKRGSKTVAKNKKSVKLSAGTYKVTTKVKYKTYKLKKKTTTTTKNVVTVGMFDRTSVTCTASSVDASSGWDVTFNATCKGSKFDGSVKLYDLTYYPEDGDHGSWDSKLSYLTWTGGVKNGKSFRAVLEPDRDLKKKKAVKKTTTVKVWSKTKSKSSTQKLVIKTKATPKKKASSSSAYYANCSAVRAAGKAPIYRGQPGYSSKLDRDGDGIGCE